MAVMTPDVDDHIDHNPILLTHHENLTYCDDVKQQYICAF